MLVMALIAGGCGSTSSATSDDSQNSDTENSDTQNSNGKWVYSGVVRTPIPDVGSLSLPDATTQAPFPFIAAKDHILVAYFGYTSCPDVCPTTLADLKAALKKMGSKAKQVDLAMATIDPRRDTAEILPAYVQSFIPTAVGLRTDDPQALATVTKAFAVQFTTDYSDPAEPKVTHSGSLYAVNSTGQIVMAWPFGTTPSDLAGDLEHLISQNGTPQQ
jgi:protein SCO1/2